MKMLDQLVQIARKCIKVIADVWAIGTREAALVIDDALITVLRQERKLKGPDLRPNVSPVYE